MTDVQPKRSVSGPPEADAEDVVLRDDLLACIGGVWVDDATKDRGTDDREERHELPPGFTGASS